MCLVCVCVISPGPQRLNPVFDCCLRNFYGFWWSRGCLSIFKRVPGWHPWAFWDFNPLSAKNSHILEHSDFNMLGVFLNCLNKLETCIHFSFWLDEILTHKVPKLSFPFIFVTHTKLVFCQWTCAILTHLGCRRGSGQYLRSCQPGTLECFEM